LANIVKDHEPKWIRNVGRGDYMGKKRNAQKVMTGKSKRNNVENVPIHKG
jgi:hypothetical protein